MVLKRKVVSIVIVSLLLGSLGSVLINALSYQVSYKEIHFVTVETTFFYIEPTPIENPEPIVNIILNYDGSMNASVFCYDTISVSDGGYVKRENQVAILGMKTSAEIYRWSFMNLDFFEDMTRGEEKLKKRLEWIAFRAGIPQSLPHLQKFRLSVA